MSGYVDEKVAKVTLDNKQFTVRIEETIKALEKLKKAFNNAAEGSKTDAFGKNMNQMTGEVEKSVNKSESLLSKLKSIFKKSTSDVDMSGAGKSIDQMNTDIANKTSKTSSILARIKSIFQKADTSDGFPNASGSIDKLNGAIASKTSRTSDLLSGIKTAFQKADQGADFPNASTSIDKLNSSIGSKTSVTADLLSRIKSMFQKADQGADFQNAISSIDKLNSKIATADASPIVSTFQNAAQGVQQSISVMDIAVGNFIGGLMTKGFNKLSGFARSFTHGMTDGFAEYGEKLGSVQTILTNTQWEGKNINDVTNALQDLNQYADQTIYSFSDMTKNIGTFTAAGVSLDKSRTAIKGIANLAAASGSNTQQASTAMYQLSQALASGKVNLMDWNSVVNAGMGGKLFKDALVETGKAMGKNIDASKNFRDTLQDGWLTADVLLETLDKFSKDQSMLDAATKVKTFSQLVDTSREAIGSGWAETWELVFGNFEQAKDLWTSINNIVDPFLNDSQGTWIDADGLSHNMMNFRNEMIKTWQATGGQQAFFNSMRNGTELLIKSLSGLRTGWREAMGSFQEQGQRLTDVSKWLEDVTFKMAHNSAITNTFRAAGQAAGAVTLALGTAFSKLFSGLGSGIGGFRQITDILLRVFTAIKTFALNIANSSNAMMTFFNIGKTIGNLISAFVSIFHAAFTVVRKFFGAFSMGDGSGFASFTLKLSQISEKIKHFAEALDQGANKMKSVTSIGNLVSTVFHGIATAVSWAFNAIASLFSGHGLSNAFSKLDSGIAGAADGLRSKLSSIVSGIANVLSGVGSKIAEGWHYITSHWKSGVDQFISIVQSLGIADIIKGIIALFAIDKWVAYKGKKDTIISKILDRAKDAFENFTKDGKSMVDNVNSVLKSFKGSIDQFTKGFKVGQLLLISGATLALAMAIKMLSGLNMEDLSKGMIGVGTSALVLVQAFKAISKVANSLPKGTSINLIAMAIAIRILCGAFAKVAAIDPKQIKVAIEGMVSAMLTMVVGMKGLSKVGDVSVGMFKLIGMATSMYILALALNKISDINPDKLIYSVSALVVLMGSLAGMTRIMNNMHISVKTTAALLPLTLSIAALAGIAYLLGKTNFESAAQGVGGVVILMNSLALVSRIMNNMKPSFRGMTSLLAMSASITILTKSVLDISKLNPEQAAIGLGSVSALIGEMIVVSMVLDSFKPSLNVIGSMIVFAGSIYILCLSVKQLSTLSMDSLLTAMKGVAALMTAMVASMYAISAIPKIPVSNIAEMIVFAGSVYVLCLTVERFASMTWVGMIKGLVGVGALMSELVALSYIVKNIKISVGSMVSIGAFVIALHAMMGPIQELAKLDPLRLATAVGGVSVLMTALALTTVILDKASGSFDKALAMAGTIKAYGSFLTDLGKAMTEMSKLNWQQILVSLGSIAAVLAMLAIMLKVTEKVKGDIGELAGLAAVIKTVGDALAKLAAVPWQGLLAATVAIGGTLAALAGGLYALQGIDGSAVFKLMGVSLALNALAIPIALLSSLSLVQVAVGVGALAASVTVLCVAGALAGAIAPGLMTLSAAMTSFGISTLIASASFSIAALGFVAFTFALKELVSIAPDAISKIVQSLASFLSALAANAPAMMASFIIVVSTAIDGLVILIPKFVTFGIKALTGIIQGLTESMPQLIDSGVKLLAALGESIISNMGTLVDVGIKVATEFIKTLANALEGVAGDLTPALVKLFKIVTNIILEILGQLVEPILSKIKEIIAPIMEFVIQQISDLSRGIEPIITPLADMFSHMFDGIAISIRAVADVIIAVVNGIVQVVQTIAPVISLAILAINNAVNSVRDIVQSICSTIQLLFVTLSTIIQTIATTINIVVTSIASTIRYVVDGIAAIIDSISNTIISLANNLSTIVQSIVDGIVSIFTVGFNSLTTIVQTVMDGIVASIQAFGDVVTRIGIAINVALQGVASVITSVGAAIQTAFEGLGSVITSIGSAISSVLSGLGDTFRGFGDGIRSALEGASKVIESFGTAIEHALSGAAKVIESLGHAIHDVLSGAADIIDSIGRSAKNAGAGFRDVGDGVATIMKYNIVNLGLHLGSVADAISKIASKSGEMQTASSAIDNLGTSFGQLSSLNLASVTASISSLATSIPQLSSSMNTLPPSITATAMAFQLFMVALQNGVISTIPIVTAAIIQMAAQVRQAAQSSFTGGEQAGQQFGISVGSGIAMGSGLAQLNASQLGILASQSAQASLGPGIGMGIGNDFGVGIGGGIGAQSGNISSIASQLGVTANSSAQLNLNSTQGSVLGNDFGMGINSGLAGQSPVVAGTAGSLAQGGHSAVQSGFSQANALGSAFGQGINGGIGSLSGTVSSTSRSLAQGGHNSVQSGFSQANALGSKFGSDISRGVSNQASSVRSSGHSVSSSGKSGAESVSWYHSGTNLAQGLANGISSMAGSVMSVAASLAHRAANAIKSALHIHSPSRVTLAFGKFFGEGFRNGITDMIGSTVKQATLMGVKTSDALEQSMTIVNDFVDRDMDITPKITPVVDLSDLQNMKDLSDSIHVGGGIIGRIKPNGQQPTSIVNSSNTTNNRRDNYNVNINIDGGNVQNARGLAEQIDQELRRRLDRNKWSTGEI